MAACRLVNASRLDFLCFAIAPSCLEFVYPFLVTMLPAFEVVVMAVPEEEEKKKTTSFGQPTTLITRGRGSATLPGVIHLCQTKCQ